MNEQLSSLKWDLSINSNWTVCIPVSTSSPTNIFAIPDTTIVIGTEIFWVPVMLASNCIHTIGYTCKRLRILIQMQKWIWHILTSTNQMGTGQFIGIGTLQRSIYTSGGKHTLFILDFWNPALRKDSYLLICSSVNCDKIALEKSSSCKSLVKMSSCIIHHMRYRCRLQ